MRQIVGQATNGLLKFSLFQSHGVTTAKEKQQLDTATWSTHKRKEEKRKKMTWLTPTTVELLCLSALRICSKKNYSHTIVRCAIANTNGKINSSSIFNCRVFCINWPPLKSNHNHFSIYEIDKKKWTETKWWWWCWFYSVHSPMCVCLCMYAMILYVSVTDQLAATLMYSVVFVVLWECKGK